jgi:RNA polymerase sigma-70 factor (ECF subfamily)
MLKPAMVVSRTLRSANVRDELLEHAFARGDASAYESAYRRYGARLYSTSLRLLRNDALAQECVHDVLLRLWQRRDAYSPQRGDLLAFLVACVRNNALSRLRNDARRRDIVAGAREATYDLEEDPIERDRIARAVSELTDTQRHMVELAYYKNMTHSEIASELGEPLGTIKSRIAAALRALRRNLTIGAQT